MNQFKHYYYIMDIDIPKDSITNNQLEIYKTLIKTITSKQVKQSEPYEIGDEIIIRKHTDVYSLRVIISFKNTQSTHIKYFIKREDTDYCNYAMTTVPLHTNININEHALVISAGANKTVLMLNFFETI